MIEIWESQREPSLVKARVAKCASTLLIRLVMVKWEFMLLTLGDRHHLDSLVVIGSLTIIRRSLWMTQLKLWVVVGDSPRRSVEESTRREHLILAWIMGSYTLSRVLQRGLVGSGDSPIPRQNIDAFPLLSLLWAFTLSITLSNSILVIYISRIAMLE